MADGKTSVESSVMPGRFGGTLRRGGGNPKRNGGRPTDEVRAACRLAFDKRIKILEQIADGKLEGDRLRAIDMLAKYGIGTTITETDTKGNDVERPQVIAYIPTHGRFLGN